MELLSLVSGMALAVSWKPESLLKGVLFCSLRSLVLRTAVRPCGQLEWPISYRAASSQSGEGPSPVLTQMWP